MAVREGSGGTDFDAIVVGAGFSGLYMLYKLREAGFTTRVLESGGGVGGTWYWNRYPGARCDVESVDYSYSFSPELEQEWTWSERYSAQPEILAYLEHVADRFELRRDIQFDTKVSSARFDEDTNCWNVTTEHGESLTARFCIMATGCLSAPKLPEIEGVETFARATYHTGHWPHEPVDFSGLRVGIIGTGSSAIQSIPHIARQAAHLTVFQRTPNFSVPAWNHPLEPDYVQEVKSDYPARRELCRTSQAGFPTGTVEEAASSVSAEARRRRYEEKGAEGGLRFLGSFTDLLVDPDANETAAEFIRSKIREIVKDPETAAALCPRDYPAGTKRLCVDIDYYETYNRPNVTLVDLRSNPIERITEDSVVTAQGTHELDALVFATGFDAMTGALSQIDIEGLGGRTLKEKWKDGPRAHLGLTAAGFPNLFMITGPGSPSVLSNMVVSIEQHVDWVTQCMAYMRAEGLERIEPQPDAEDEWVELVSALADFTLFPRANSWYRGANVEGKAQVFMPYVGGVYTYRQQCDEVAQSGYKGFSIS